ncbi:MAG TPA: hypothetical protein VFP46_00105 [Candidatus Paceibacterota bacterium]|nr:hypothetical protein [Candidatus Paceibacterota bacterium]
MDKKPLWMYVVAVIVVMALINAFAWYTGKPTNLRTMSVFSTGFLIGMLAMYIAVHVYSW